MFDQAQLAQQRDTAARRSRSAETSRPRARTRASTRLAAETQPRQRVGARAPERHRQHRRQRRRRPASCGSASRSPARRRARGSGRGRAPRGTSAGPPNSRLSGVNEDTAAQYSGNSIAATIAAVDRRRVAPRHAARSRNARPPKPRIATSAATNASAKTIIESAEPKPKRRFCSRRERVERERLGRRAGTAAGHARRRGRRRGTRRARGTARRRAAPASAAAA